MASGGSSDHPVPSSRQTFDFGSYDVLCPHDDFAVQNLYVGKRSDSPMKEYQESMKGRPLINIYEQEECPKGVLSSVDKCMKKYADNVLCVLEGINSRLSQLEMHCYKLDQAIGDFRSDIIHDHADAEQRFKTLEKQIQEVHRSIQILRDKQKLAETKKELSELQLVRKECAWKNQDSVKQFVSDLNKTDDQPNTPNQNLSLALLHQGSGPGLSARIPENIQLFKQVLLHHQVPVAPNVQQERYVVNQAGTIYHNQLLQPDLQYVQVRPQDIPLDVPKQQLQTISRNQSSSYSQCHQQWTQQLPQQMPEQEVTVSSVPSDTRMRSQMLYPPYSLQPASAISESFSAGTHVQVFYPAVPRPNNIHPEASFAYSGTGSSVSQPSPQHNIQRHAGTATYSSQYNIQGYNDAYSYRSGNHSALQNEPPSRSSGLHQHAHS